MQRTSCQDCTNTAPNRMNCVHLKCGVVRLHYIKLLTPSVQANTVHFTNTHEGNEGIVPGINLSTRAVSGQSASSKEKKPLSTEQEVWWTSKPVWALA